MKIVLRFQTVIGPRTVIAATPDEATARAVVNAHLAAGEYAEMCDPGAHFTVKQILARRKPKKRVKPPANVVLLKKVKK